MWFNYDVSFIFMWRKLETQYRAADFHFLGFRNTVYARQISSYHSFSLEICFFKMASFSTWLRYIANKLEFSVSLSWKVFHSLSLTLFFNFPHGFLFNHCFCLICCCLVWLLEHYWIFFTIISFLALFFLFRFWDLCILGISVRIFFRIFLLDHHWVFWFCSSFISSWEFMCIFTFFFCWFLVRFYSPTFFTEESVEFCLF